jgi:hypothetical protein
VINVTIERIDVRTPANPVARIAPRQSEVRPLRSLEAYLRERNGTTP